jgi:DNA-binding GntR family transcriptional regulator
MPLKPSLITTGGGEQRYRGSVRTMGDAIFLELREMIISGVLPPDAPLRLHDLAERMQVSVQPIREAIRRLESIGLVEVIPNRGGRVRPMSVGDLRDTYVVRLHLETYAIQRAATRFTDDDAAAARTSLADHVRLERAGEVESARAAHTAFHFAIYKASGSPWLVRSIQPLWENSERYRLLSLRARGSLTRRRQEHERILDACIAGDPAAAAAELDHHLRRTANLTAKTMGSPDIF